MRRDADNEAGLYHRRARILISPLLVLLALSGTAASSDGLLDVSVTLFDADIAAESPVSDDHFPQIRRVESLLWSFSLRRELARSDRFGVVRLMAGDDALSDLVVTGKILSSNGLMADVEITATDASGTVWLSKTYSGDVSRFSHIATSIRLDLDAYAEAMDARSVERLREIALLRYGARLAPSAFAGFFTVDDGGRVNVLRLPSPSDPMVRRLKRVREASYLINDAIDEKFSSLQDDVGDVYALWNRYKMKFAGYKAENRRRGLNGSDFPRGTYEHYQRLYDLYKWDRQTAQEQSRLAAAFDNEVGPRLSRMTERVDELLVWMDAKNAEWYRLLEALFDAETRSEPVPAAE